MACAFPSACGKTNLAMLIPPDTMPGWEVFTVGDDIAWLHPGPDGRLWAINPESGYFGVAPGTGPKTNRNAYDMIRKDTLFTNVALTADNQPWWEGIGSGAPAIDWLGRPFDKANGPAAHPNSRFTVSAVHNPSYTTEAENPRGVPISALVFGGRRRELAPLVYQARDWAHGVLMGASVASETTAAATGAVGVVRRDPMAMKPFCGYNFADYWQHWLNVGAKLAHPPGIFHVNWFRQGADGKFLWPGFGDNLRVLAWILDRCAGRAQAQDTPIGFLPSPSDLDTSGLDIDAGTLAEILSVKPEAWRQEVADIRSYLGEYGARTPQALLAEVATVEQRLGGSTLRESDAVQTVSDSQLKRSVCTDSSSGTRPSPIRPLPLICRLSRRTKASSPSVRCTNVPLVLWSINMTLLRRNSSRACTREMRLPRMITSFSSARPMVSCGRLASSTRSRSGKRKRIRT